MKGHYTNIAREDSLVVSLRLVEPKAQEWNLYGNTTRVDLVKCPPFKMNEFLKIKKEDDKVNLSRSIAVWDNILLMDIRKMIIH